MKLKLCCLTALAATIGVAEASAGPSKPSYATSLPACYSTMSPILDPHYGYDDRRCPHKMIELRAVDEGDRSLRSQPSHPHYATSLPACLSNESPLLDPHYGYNDASCAQSIESSGERKLENDHAG
jgi:hypothetical protein